MANPRPLLIGIVLAARVLPHGPLRTPDGRPLRMDYDLRAAHLP